MFKNFSRNSKVLFFIYLGLIALFSIYSFGLTTPNLILINSSWFSSFQFWMWKIFFNNRKQASAIYAIFITIFCILYILLIKSLSKDKPVSIKQQILLIVLISLPLLISSNMLSNDVFNYIFNSRMILKYQANPYLKTALDFPFDDWTRFMHNIHTPAPYGYGWTGLSLLPYFFGAEKFLLTWINYRFFSLISLVVSSIAISKLYSVVNNKKMNLYTWAIFFFNPLVLIEVLNNFHNDLWMMAPAVTSIALLLNKKRNLTRPIFLLIFSISIKYATLALLPIFIIIILSRLKALQNNNLLKMIVKFTPEISSILMFLPLLTSRSQQFHPWYLLWALIWIPATKIKVLKTILMTFSITSLFRYIPWMLNNGYSQEILIQQKMITWLAIPLSLLLYFFLMNIKNDSNVKTK